MSNRVPFKAVQAFEAQALDYVLGHEDVWFTVPEEIYRWHVEGRGQA